VPFLPPLDPNIFQLSLAADTLRLCPAAHTKHRKSDGFVYFNIYVSQIEKEKITFRTKL
jgi:hypothetical protein